jgi:hypothetical protein
MAMAILNTGFGVNQFGRADEGYFTKMLLKARDVESINFACLDKLSYDAENMLAGLDTNLGQFLRGKGFHFGQLRRQQVFKLDEATNTASRTFLFINDISRAEFKLLGITRKSDSSGALHKIFRMSSADAMGTVSHSLIMSGLDKVDQLKHASIGSIAMDHQPETVKRELDLAAGSAHTAKATLPEVLNAVDKLSQQWSEDWDAKVEQMTWDTLVGAPEEEESKVIQAAKLPDFGQWA